MLDRQSGPASVDGVEGYVVEEEVSRSVRGVVYRARKAGRLVALKVYSGPDQLASTSLEALVRTTDGAVRHASIVGIQEVGVTADGRPFVAMDHLWGDSLRETLDDHVRGTTDRPSLSPLAVGPDGSRHPEYLQHAVRVIAEVAEGLESVHRAGIYHHAITPRNLVFSPSGRLALTDFGTPPGRIDRDEDLPYRAPEQLTAVPDGGGARTDVYALGAVLYELVTHRAPYEGADRRELERWILRGRPAAPSSLRDDVPAALQECILQALSAKVEDRYSSAASFAADLRRFLRGEKPLARRLKAVRARMLSRDESPIAFPTRVAVAGILTALLTVSIFSGYRLHFASQLESTASTTIRYLDRQDYEGAVGEVRRLASLNPSNTAAQALDNLVSRVADSEEASRHLVGALGALESGDHEAAIRHIDSARDRVSGPTEMASLKRRILETSRRDPLLDSLEDRRTPMRKAALEILAGDITSGRRPPDDLRLAAPALRDADPDVQSLAYGAFEAAGRGEELLASLNVAPGRDRVRMGGAAFLRLFGALSSIGDEAASSSLARWPLDAMLQLDELPDGLALDLAPNLRIVADHGAPWRFTRAWLRTAGSSHEDELLSTVRRLQTIDDLSGEIVEALERIGSTRSNDALVSMALERPLHLGLEAVAALESSESAEHLIRLAGSDLPLGVREAAVDALTSAEGDGATSALRCFVEFDPEPSVRRIALTALIERPAETAERVESAELLLTRSLEDSAVRDLALEWLDTLPDRVSSRISLDILTLSWPEARKRAHAVLARDSSIRVLGGLVQKALSPSAQERLIALDLIGRRTREVRFRNMVERISSLARSRVVGLASDVWDGALLRYEMVVEMLSMGHVSP